MGIRIGIKPADAVQVDDGDGPDVRSLLDRIHDGWLLDTFRRPLRFVCRELAFRLTGDLDTDLSELPLEGKRRWQNVC